MKKYLAVFRNSLKEYFVYRFNFLLWRIRIIISMLITYYLWMSIFGEQNRMFGYSIEIMLTYILLLTFINGFVLSTRTSLVGEEINLGFLSKYLIRPVNYFRYNLFRDLSNKVINFCLSAGELILLYLILRPPVFIQPDIFWWGLFLLSVIIASFLFFEIGLSLSLFGFWIHDTWPLRFLFFIILSFAAGNFFPLDILPKPLFEILTYSPFTYLIFFPVKIYLGQVDRLFLLKGLSVSFAWIIFFRLLLQWMWKKGLKIYTAEGQ